MHTLILLMMIKHIPPTRVTYWKDNGDESDFMLVGTLENGEHDRVCGFIARSEGGWDVITLKSGGARNGFDMKADNLDIARSKVEEDCR